MTRRLPVLLLICLLAGCGGAQPQAEGAEPASEDESMGAGESSGAPAEPGAAPGLKETGAKAEASGDDLTPILQLVIDDAELDPYLKLGEAGRFPLKVSGDKVAGLNLVKATKPVQIVAGPKDKSDPVLVISAIEIEGTNATVTYKYDIEGIRGTARLSKGPHGWELKNSRIVEHKAGSGYP